MADLQKIVDDLSSLTVLESAELMRLVEESWGVAAAAAIALAASFDREVRLVEDEREFSVILTSAGDNRVAVMKEIRALTGLGLRETRDLINAIPKVIQEALTEDVAAQITQRVLAVGGTATYFDRPTTDAYLRSTVARRADKIKELLETGQGSTNAIASSISAEDRFRATQYQRMSSSVEADMIIEQLSGNDRSAVEAAVASLLQEEVLVNAAPLISGTFPLRRFGASADVPTQLYMIEAERDEFRILFSIQDHAVVVQDIFRTSQLTFFRN